MHEFINKRKLVNFECPECGEEGSEWVEFPNALVTCDECEHQWDYTRLVIPEQAELAQCFLGGGDHDPYVFAAQRMYPEIDWCSLSTQDKEALRKKVKKTFLAVLYGQSARGVARDMRISVHDAEEMQERLESGIPELVPYKEFIGQLIRHTGEATSLFGRKRRFAGLYQLRSATQALVRCSLRDLVRKLWEFDVSPIQLWNWTLHSYVHEVRNHTTGEVIADSNSDNNHPALSRAGMNRWPFRNLSYKTIRSVTIGNDIIKFTPIEDCMRQGFNAIFQMTAGDVFKRAMLNVQSVCEIHDARMILNVHDELVFTVPNGNLHAFVEDAVDAMTQPPTSWWAIPIEVDVEHGPNYGQLTSYKLSLIRRIINWVTALLRRLWNWIKSLLE